MVLTKEYLNVPASHLFEQTFALPPSFLTHTHTLLKTLTPGPPSVLCNVSSAQEYLFCLFSRLVESVVEYFLYYSLEDKRINRRGKDSGEVDAVNRASLGEIWNQSSGLFLSSVSLRYYISAPANFSHLSSTLIYTLLGGSYTHSWLCKYESTSYKMVV